MRALFPKDLVRGVPPGMPYAQEAGGGGDPKQRPARKVAEEVRGGIISLEQVREACGVILDERTLELDGSESSRQSS